MRVRIHAELDTDVPSEMIREALLDFTDRRPAIWPQLDPDTYQVHSVGETSADVTEGSPRPMVWSREHYDWSEPNKISWISQESNFCTPGSGIVMEIHPLPDGRSHVAVTWDRTAANMRGRFFMAPVALGGGKLLAWATKRSLNDISKYLTGH